MAALEIREQARPAAAAGLPQQLLRYVMATSWQHQLPLVALTIAVFLLEVVPLEMQRRIVNDIVKHRPYAAIVLLCAAYLGAVLLQGGTKLALNIYRGWVGERAKRDLRSRICGLPVALNGLPESQGTAASMVVAEVEPIGGFIGSALSEPLLQAGIMATVISYITHIDPWMGAAALALFVPQLVFVPLMQNAMNRRTGVRVWLLRQIGAGVIARADAGDAAARARIDRVFRLDMGIFELKFTMNFLMNVCSRLQVIAALLLGGWWVLGGKMQIGGVVAFISGVGQLNDPWGDLVNYYRDVTMNRVRFRLLAEALSQIKADGRHAA